VPNPNFRIPGGRGGGDPFSGFYDRDGTEYLDTWGLSLSGQWNLGPVVIQSLTGYEWYDRFVVDEGDANPSPLFPADWSDGGHQITTELRFLGEGENYSWTAGALYLQEKLDAFNVFPDTRDFRLTQSFDQQAWAFGPYLQGRYGESRAWGDWGVEGGFRYNWEHKRFGLETTATGQRGDQRSVSQVDATVEEMDWSEPTGEVVLRYSPPGSVVGPARIDALNLYAKYSHGFKVGHFNAGILVPQSNDSAEVGIISPVEPEFIDAVEVGFKSNWLEDRLVLNVAAFRYWYTDLQVFDINNQLGELPTQQLLNGDARVWGAELQLEARPIPGLFVQSGLGWLDSTFKDFSVDKAISQPRGIGAADTLDYDGHKTISAPTWSWSGVVEYEIPLFGYGSLVPQYGFSFKSKVYLDPQQLDPISQPAYWLHNLRLAYRTESGRIEVAGWVRNLLDERYRIDVFDVSIEFNEILEVWGRPRTYGITLSYVW
jgi:iron complex outermembrane receptor protein